MFIDGQSRYRTFLVRCNLRPMSSSILLVSRSKFPIVDRRIVSDRLTLNLERTAQFFRLITSHTLYTQMHTSYVIWRYNDDEAYRFEFLN